MEPGHPPPKSNPITPGRRVAEISVIDPQVERATVRVKRCERVGATTTIVHQQRFLLGRPVGAHHVNGESGAPRGVEHLSDLALYIGIHRGDAAAGDHRRSRERAAGQTRQPTLKLFPRFSPPADGDEADPVRVYVAGRTTLRLRIVLEQTTPAGIRDV